MCEYVVELCGFMDCYDLYGGCVYVYCCVDGIIVVFMDVGIGIEGGWEIVGLFVVEGEYNWEELLCCVWDEFFLFNFGYFEVKGMIY